MNHVNPSLPNSTHVHSPSFHSWVVLVASPQTAVVLLFIDSLKRPESEMEPGGGHRPKLPDSSIQKQENLHVSTDAKKSLTFANGFACIYIYIVLLMDKPIN